QEDYFYLQKLLMETAQQPDVDYMVITDNRGLIIADSDPSMLGRQYGLDLNTKAIAGSMDISWRQTANPGGAGTFEVYRGFAPEGSRDISRRKSPWIVFVGFNMEKIEKASSQDTARMIGFALLLVLFGSLAIVSLFLVQTYRLTRASLSRITVFSDALVKNLPIALVAVDKDGKVLTCNMQAEGLINGACEDAAGKDASRILPNEFLQTLDQTGWQTGLVAGDVVVPSGKDARTIWEVVATTFSEEHAPEGKILLARNVTDVRRMETEVAKSRHLNAIGSLAAGVAHEIRNPLSSIKGFAVYFKGRLAGNPEDEETADIMIAETERLNRVISQLIEFARPMELKKEPVALDELARQTLLLVAADARNKSVATEVQAASNLPPAWADPDKIKQVLLNIYLNALAAMPEGGKLTVTFAAENDFLEISVSDTGEGIEEENLPRIYDPYFTSKPAGTGLGLAVVQKIMEAHGGSVKIESKVKAGTTVTLRFVSVAAERKTT
ncbi:MAG TPA: ATP-binding protein, partial [Smithellaceae bacterium]|nr:ATP-binding protein [Smithellaceae bacterium]